MATRGAPRWRGAHSSISGRRGKGHRGHGACREGRHNRASFPCPSRKAVTHEPGQERSARQHADRLGRADPDGRRRRAARRRVPPGRGREVSGDPELRALREGARVPGRLQERLDPHDERVSGDRRRLVEQVPELGAGRSREMGAGRLRDRAGRFARRRPLARLSRSVVAARGAGHATTASNGPVRKPGATARSASAASRTMR